MAAKTRTGDNRGERELDRLWLESAWGSARFAGFSLPLEAVRALVAHGLVDRPAPLREVLIAWGCLRAARFIRTQRPPAPGKPWLTLGEVRRLHHLLAEPEAAMTGTTAEADAWRTVSQALPGAGVVNVPPALVNFELSAFVDRVALGPRDRAIGVWLAEVHERLDRIRPFAHANGRLARAIVTLLLHRARRPPIALTDRAAYARARAAADAGDIAPLATLFTRRLEATEARLAAVDAGEPLAPLRTFAGADLTLEALKKAALRGRLKTVIRGRARLTTSTWVQSYLAQRGYPSAANTSS